MHDEQLARCVIYAGRFDAQENDVEMFYVPGSFWVCEKGSCEKGSCEKGSCEKGGHETFCAWAHVANPLQILQAGYRAGRASHDVSKQYMTVLQPRLGVCTASQLLFHRLAYD